MLNFPAVSLRESMEKPEAQDAGTIIFTDLNRIKITQPILQSSMDTEMVVALNEIADDYMIENTS